MRLRIATIVLLFISAAACAQERFPPPEFRTDYKMPAPTTPQPRLAVLDYVDMAVLAAALGVASYLAVRRRSRAGMVAMVVFTAAYFGFYRRGCVCPIGAIQNVAVGLFDSAYAVPLVVLGFFMLPLLTTLLFGRSFCAGVCPLGAVQDIVLIRPLRVPSWLEQALGMMAYVYLGAAVLFAVTGSGLIICQYDPFVSFFRLSGGMTMLILGGCLLIVGMFVGRPYCRFLCPYAVLLRPLSCLSRWRVTVTPAECVKCGLCEDACPFGAIRAAGGEAVRRPGKAHLALLILALPALTGAGALLGRSLDVPLSRMNRTVCLAERVAMEESGAAAGRTGASEAFRATGRAVGELYDEAAGVRERFTLGSAVFSGFIGMVIGLKLLGVSLRRPRTDYEADRAACVACGRCFKYCPIERKRLKSRKGPSAT